jgi:hypothetical protein
MRIVWVTSNCLVPAHVSEPGKVNMITPKSGRLEVGNLGLICRLPRDGPHHPQLAGITHAPPHSLIIVWELLGSALPMG